MKKMMIKIIKDGSVTELFGLFSSTSEAVTTMLADDVFAVTVKVVV